MMGGAMGEGAQGIAQDFRAGQRQAINDAATTIEGTAGRGQVALERNQDAGRAVMDRVQNLAQTARNDYRGRYDTAFAQEGALDPAVFTGRATSAANAASDAYSAPISRRITDALVSAPNLTSSIRF